MKKIICDICGKELPLTYGIREHALKDMNFAISSNGRLWDICQECRDSLNDWIMERKNEEVQDNSK